MEHYTEDLGEEDPLTALQWDDNFYDAVDASIHRAISEAMVPLQSCISCQIAQECEKLARAVPGQPASL